MAQLSTPDKKSDSHVQVSAGRQADEIKEWSQQTVFYLMAGNFILGLIMAPVYSTWLLTLGVGGGCLLVYFFLTQLAPDTFITKALTISLLSLYVFQFIWQLQGKYQMHLLLMIYPVLIIMYQEWRLCIHYLASIFICFALFFYFKPAFYFVDGTQAFLAENFISYAGLLVSLTCLCGWLSHLLKIKSQAMQQHKLMLEQQQAYNAHNISFAEEISKGNLQAIHTIQQGDELARSLVGMQQSLLKAASREEEERYVNLGLAQVSETLRSQNSSIEELCVQIIQKLVKYLGANQGGIFLLMEEENDPHLMLTGCYAFERRKFLKKRIEKGEGLLGQAFMEQDTIYITDVPDEYVHITSGLGKANPTSILIVPLKSNDKLVGIIEFASFQPIAAYQQHFLTKASQIIAATIITANTNERTKKLLQESFMQSEVMREQEVVLRQNMEELATAQEEMTIKGIEMERLLEDAKKKETAMQEQEKMMRASMEELAALQQQMYKKDQQQIQEISDLKHSYQQKESEMQTLLLEMKINEEDMQKNEENYRMLIIKHQTKERELTEKTTLIHQLTAQVEQLKKQCPVK